MSDLLNRTQMVVLGWLVVLTGSLRYQRQIRFLASSEDPALGLLLESEWNAIVVSQHATLQTNAGVLVVEVEEKQDIEALAS